MVANESDQPQTVLADRRSRHAGGHVAGAGSWRTESAASEEYPGSLARSSRASDSC